ncbi:MAG: hypothetical protein R3C14_42060 [Caldilineaceae bacterium]
MADQTTEQTIAEIWQLFKETDAKFKETDAKFKETDSRLDRSFAETNAEIARTSAEVARTTVNLQKLEGLFGNQWGRLIEALVQPGVLSLFQQRGHDVRRLHRRSKAQVNGTTMEIDIILEDQTEVIAIEVKTNLTTEDVNDFLDDLAEFTRYFPLYRAYHIYGAVAGLDIPQDVARYAYRRGLFVVSITGSDLVQILNDTKFQPRDFGETR